MIYNSNLITVAASITVLCGLMFTGIINSSAYAVGWSNWKEFGGTTDVALAPVAFGNKLYLFSKGIGDKKIYVSSSSDGNSWSNWKEFGGTTDVSVTPVSYQGDLYLFAKGIGDKRIYVTSGRPGENKWSGWYELPPRGTSTITKVAAVAFENKLYLFRKDVNDNRIYEQSIVINSFPFRSKSVWSLGRGNWDDHVNAHPFGQAYALDFTHSEGGNVLAVREGTVIAFKADRPCNSYNVEVGNPCYGAPGEGNYVLVRHSDGTVAAYDHLMKDRVFVTNSTKVKVGDLIGLSGNTGYSTQPHLHLDVRSFWNNPGDMGPTIPLYFKDNNHASWRPMVGDTISP